MPTIPAAVATVQAAVAPVVLLDTCVLLDIVRAPHRNAAATVHAATELLTGAQRNPPTIHLVIAPPTPTEWNDHIDECEDDCVIAVSSADAVAEAWSYVGLPGLPMLPVGAQHLPARLRKLSKDLLDVAILLDKDGGALGRAIDRVIKSEIPAKKGGKGAKDAVILEHAIGLAQELRAVGFTRLCIFASSNTNDFAVTKTTTLHPVLQPLFNPPTDLRYSASLQAAVTLLKANGWVP